MNYKHTKLKSALAVACMSLCLTATAGAEELKEYDLDGTVVTATRTAMDSKKVPQAVQVITQQDIKDMAAQNLFDALKLASNISLQKAGMVGNNVQIRGMDNRHTLIMIDGKRMAGEDSSETANVYELSRINLDNVERIEIVRGPGSVMYGSDAMGGVINIITKKSASSKPTYNFSADAGSDERNLSMNFDSGKQGNVTVKAGVRLTNVLENTSGYLEGTTNMFGNRQHYNFSLDYDLGKNRGIEFAAEYMEEDLQAASTVGQYEWYNNKRQAFSMNYYGKDNKNDYNIRAYYNQLQKDFKQAKGDAWMDFDIAQYDSYAIEGRNTVKIDDKHRLTYGAEFRENRSYGTRMAAGGDNVHQLNNLGMSKDASNKAINSYGLYVQDEWQIGDKLLVIPALRVDKHNTFGTNFTPKIGATYSFDEHKRVKVNYGKGYRAPTIFELYAQMRKSMGGMNVTVDGNPNLKPEESTSFDIAFEAEKDNLWGKISYFHNDIKNLIDTQVYFAGYIPGSGMNMKAKYVNVDRAEINGIEVEGGINLNKNYTIKTTYNYLDANNKTSGERLSGRAKHNATLQFIYTDNQVNPLTLTLWQEWNIDYRYSWGTSKYKDYTFSTTNLAVNKKINKQLDIFAGVNNIFDKKYTVSADETFYFAGRSWRVGMNMSF